MKLHLPTKILFVILGLMLLAAAAVIIFNWHKFQAQRPVQPAADLQSLAGEIAIARPIAGQAVTSPLALSGQAMGSWYFEGSFPVSLVDEDGTVLGQSAVIAQSDWTVNSFVPFSGSLEFKMPKGSRGTLVFSNDNPSGLATNHKEFKINVSFSQPSSSRPSGTCAPNTAVCHGDAELCMKQAVAPLCD